MVGSAILIPTVRRAWCRFVLATESTEFGRLELLSWVEALLEANVQMAEGAPFPPPHDGGMLLHAHVRTACARDPCVVFELLASKSASPTPGTPSYITRDCAASLVTVQGIARPPF